MAATDTADLGARMTQEELLRTMRTLEPVYDMVRLVDPSVTQGRTMTQDGELDMPHQCYDLLNKGRRCKNCISARTVGCKRSVSKFEFVGDDAFYISTRYVEVDGEPRSLELVKQITGDTLAAPLGDEAIEQARSIVESDPDRRYLDRRTGALSRRYLDEGIDSLRGDKVAMLRVVTSTPGAELPTLEDKALRAVAATVLAGIRETDTLVHYDEQTFAIVFEGVPGRIFSDRLRQLQRRASDALSGQGGCDGLQVVVGAVMREGAIGDLIATALDALEQADPRDCPLVLVGADEEQETPAELADVPPTGTRVGSLDALTGLLAPRTFRRRLQQRMVALHEGERLQVVHLDVENFKAFNRAYGLAVGDELLSGVAATIREAFPGDLATRTSIDMFAVATAAPDVEARFARVRDDLHRQRRDVAIDLKGGICVVGDDSLSAHAAMDHAKIACDSIKGKFGLALRRFDEKLERQVSMRARVVENLDEAIRNGYVRPYYQPIVRSVTGKICAVEALSRWEDPEHGLLSPADVIPALETHHLIHKHDAHIVRCICRDQRRLIDAGMDVTPVSVNLSRLDFDLCDIFREVEDAVADAGIPRKLLDIEVTESTLDEGSSRFRTQVERFRDAGYEVWMDDFGSGYSSLNVLKDYEFDVLKIDMEFLRGIEDNRHSRQIVSSIVDMAKRLGIRTLAEGVETETQCAFLRGIGCEMIQGFYFARPAPFGLGRQRGRLDVESADDRAYFESVGRVNLLSQEPAEALGTTDEPRPERRAPLAVVEWDGRTIHFLSYNDAFARHLQSEGFSGALEAEQAFGGDLSAVECFARAARRAEQCPGEHRIDYGLGPDDPHASLQFVARGNRYAAFVLGIRPA